MKKSWFLLFMLLCSVSFFTGCSDDKDDSWKNIPDKEISGTDANLTVNGIASTGSVKLTVQSSELAVLDLKNVIDGYPEVSLDVTLTKQTDTTYTFVGSKDLTTVPTKATEKLPTLLKVDVKGSVTLSGNVNLEVVTSGIALYFKTYKDNNLELFYSEDKIAGKEVELGITDDKDVTLTLRDIIPGETETILSNIQVEEKEGTVEFKGKAVSGGNADITYSGSVKNGVLTLNLEVIMPNSQGWAKTYGLGDYTTGPLTIDEMKMSNAPLTSALYAEWVATDDRYAGTATTYAVVFRGILGIILPQALHSITLEPDGNIRAEYSEDSIHFDPNWAIGLLFSGNAPGADVVNKLIPTSGWVQSPKNLAYWFEKNSKLYVKLNIPAIIEQASKDKPETDTNLISKALQGILADKSMDASKLKQMLSSISGFIDLGIDISVISDETINMLLSWMRDGIPMSVKMEKGHTYICLDKTAFDPILTDKENTPGDDEYGTKSDLIKVFTLLVNAKLIPEEYQLAGLLLPGMCMSWPTTTSFYLGLDLVAQ